MPPAARPSGSRSPGPHRVDSALRGLGSSVRSCPLRSRPCQILSVAVRGARPWLSLAVRVRSCQICPWPILSDLSVAVRGRSCQIPPWPRAVAVRGCPWPALSDWLAADLIRTCTYARLADRVPSSPHSDWAAWGCRSSTARRVKPSRLPPFIGRSISVSPSSTRPTCTGRSRTKCSSARPSATVAIASSSRRSSASSATPRSRSAGVSTGGPSTRARVARPA